MKTKTLTYEDLKNGEFYTASYPNQGKYIFKQGFPLWISTKYCEIRTATIGSFNPGNGFHEFEEATKEEINFLTKNKPSSLTKNKSSSQNNIKAAHEYLIKQGCNLNSHIINYDTIAKYLVNYAKTHK